MSFFFFDIKDDSVIEFLPSIISKWNLKDRLIVGSVYPKPNKMLQKCILPEIPICPDFVTVLKMIIFYCFGLSWLIPSRHPIMGLHISEYTTNILTTRLLSYWKSRNFIVVLFGEGINDAITQKDFIQKGIDVLLTDRPDILRDVLGPSKNRRAT